jgi:hypothetical protein
MGEPAIDLFRVPGTSGHPTKPLRLMPRAHNDSRGRFGSYSHGPELFPSLLPSCGHQCLPPEFFHTTTMKALAELPYPLKLIDTTLGLTADACDQLYFWILHLRRTEGREFNRSEVLCRLLLTYKAPVELPDTMET